MASVVFVPCKLCGHKLKPGELHCPSCKHWNFGDPNEDNTDTVLLSDAKLEETKRIDVGWLNPIFGVDNAGNSGIAETSVNLIAGPPGAGKSTLFLQISDVFAELFPGREILHIATEQQPNEILSIARRIGVKHLGQIRVVKAMAGLNRNMFEMFEQYKPCLIIVDSLTMLCQENLDLQVKVAMDIKRGTMDLKSPSLLVNQVNKQEDQAGLMQLQHAVDCLIMLDKDDSSGERAMYSKKNRFGAAPKLLLMEMTPEDSKNPGKLIPKEMPEEVE
jgi:DNA repair protein RadA/Sms